MSDVDGVLIVARIWALIAMAPLWRCACGLLWWVISGLLAIAVVLTSSQGSVFVRDGFDIGEVSQNVWGWALALELVCGAVIGRVLGLGGELVLGAAAQNEQRLAVEEGLGVRLWACMACAMALVAELPHRAWILLHTWIELAPAGQPWLLWPALSLERVGDVAADLGALGLALMTPVWLTCGVIELIHVAAWPQAGQGSPGRVAWRCALGLLAWWASWHLTELGIWAAAL